ncbi:hypothetical protein DSO57_1015094 [Entomophthora muscae]|uniref:Uncharacterized protein n=1 Tax=Entomophthora muscae TaxID=34485 RepID=A0ACC2U3Q1_9FUNG|nr:hypothetical protein DSO57_1015094 [Entomophthora muscae]
MPQFELVQTSAPCEVTSTHHVFKGGHCFELALYAPVIFLEEGRVEKLRCTLALLQSSPTLLCHRDGLKHGDASHPLFSISIIINTKVFQPDQWCHASGNSDAAIETRDYLKAYPTFLDQASAISSHYKLPHDSVSLLIVRPDLHVGTIMHPSPESIQKEIESYFSRFLNIDY